MGSRAAVEDEAADILGQMKQAPGHILLKMTEPALESPEETVRE